MIKISLKLIKKALDLDILNSLSLTYEVPEEWIQGCEDYLLTEGLATKLDLEALKETVGNKLLVDFKKQENLEEKINSGLVIDPSTMTVSYGPFVVDDYMKDKTLTEEMIVK
jgi:hypothetical protein